MTLLLIVFSEILLFSQGTKFFEGSLKEALELSKNENKLIFVDVYTSWCKPCLKMKKDVLPLKEVGDFFNERFINLSIDLDTWKGLEFSLFYNVSSFPTFLFIDKNGSVVHREFGFKNQNRLIKMAKYAMKRFDNTTFLLEKWNEGKKDYAFIRLLANSLNKINKPSEKFVLDFLSSNELSNSIRIKFIFETINGSTGALFNELTKNENWRLLKKLYQKDVIQSKFRTIFKKELQNNVKSQGSEKEKIIFSSINKVFPEFSNEFELYYKLLILEKKKEYSKYLKTTEKFFNTITKEDQKRDFIKNLYNKTIGDKRLLSTAQDLSEVLYQNHKISANFILYIKLLVLNKDYTKVKGIYDSITKTDEGFDKLDPNNELKRYFKFSKKRIH